MFKKIVWLGFSTKWKNAKDLEKYIASLVEWWANEFFTWYNPEYWSSKFGFEVSPNWRFAEHEQITDFETLKWIVNEVHKYSLEIFINLNAWYYTNETFPLIEKMFEEFEKVWVDWIICWNIGILEYLKNKWYKWKINISTILAVYNTEAIKFFLENYNINKIILSREVTLKEIENLVTIFPETKFEVFWEWDFCRYNNWLCFAEHKYWAKDICTVVLDDLIVKKKFRSDFKEFVLDKNLSNEDKIDKMNDEHIDNFEKLSMILWKIELWLLDKESLEKELYNTINILKNRVDLFFDSLKPINSKKNTNIIVLLRSLKYLLLNKPLFIDEKEYLDIKKLHKESEDNFKSGMKSLTEKTKELWWLPKLKALELWSLYWKVDNLNLYSYLFFSNFKNIETVKFPTRWRNYNEKIKLIEKVLQDWKVDDELLDRGISIERAHYDLTYIFKNKYRFREMIKNK